MSAVGDGRDVDQGLASVMAGLDMGGGGYAPQRPVQTKKADVKTIVQVGIVEPPPFAE